MRVCVGAFVCKGVELESERESLRERERERVMRSATLTGKVTAFSRTLRLRGKKERKKGWQRRTSQHRRKTLGKRLRKIKKEAETKLSALWYTSANQ